MKLIIAIVNEQIAPGLIEEMTSKGFGVTGMSSSGGFLHKGNRTILSAVEEDEAPLLLQLVKEYTQKKKLQNIQDEIHKKKAVNEGMVTAFVVPIEKVFHY